MQRATARTSMSTSDAGKAGIPVGFRVLPVIVTAVLLTVLSGCFAVRPSGETAIPMFWPAPPDTTRIKLVRTLASQNDFGHKMNVRESLEIFLTGQAPPLSHLGNPLAIAVSDDAQRVYVSDMSQATVYQFDLANKEVHLIGRPGASGRKPFARPVGIALDGQENLYIVDTTGKAVVVLDRDGKMLRRFKDKRLERPTGIAIDRERGIMYVTNTSHQKSSLHHVEAYSLDGKHLFTVGKGKGLDPDAFRFPTYLTLDQDGDLYVADTINGRIQVFDPRGKYLRSVGQHGDRAGNFGRPKGVAVDTFGNLYVVDSEWANVQIFNRKGQVLLFFGGRGRYPGLLNNPTGIAIDKNNRIYVADTLNYRVNVYQLVNTTAEDSLMPDSDVEEDEGKEKP